MNQVNNSVVHDLAVGLECLNREAFAKMAQCGHRVVNIEKETASKFLVTTNCTSGHNRCLGEMEFCLTREGPNLYLAKFNHHEQCLSAGRGFESGTIEDIPCHDQHFATRWWGCMAESARLAAANVDAVVQRMAQDVASGYDQVGTSADCTETGRVAKSIESLRNQLAEYYAEDQTTS